MSFQLPLPGLFADMETGSASIALPDEFLDAAPALRVEVLQQWLVDLSLLRNDAVVEMFRAQAKLMPQVPADRQIEQFRLYCLRNGFDCPLDLPLLADACKGGR